MARIVVTGGAGFIGSHLCEALLRRGDTVVALDCFDDFYDPAIKRSNLSFCHKNSGFSLAEGDIRDTEFVGRTIAGADAIVHLAARAGVRPSIEQPLLYQDVNIRGTMVLLEAARLHGITRFVLAGSSSVYGNNEKIPFSEADNVDYPISPYAATKKACELLCHSYCHLYGIGITVLRYFTVYGPRQRPDLAIHKFARLIEAERPIPVFGDGGMMRDFTYIDDIVSGTVAGLDRCEGYHIYNLGEATPIRLSDLIAALEKALGKKAIIERLPLQPGDVERTFADVALARRELAYQPSTDIDTGLTKFVSWLRGTPA